MTEEEHLHWEAVAEEEEALGRRAIACKQWKWMPGMRTLAKQRIPDTWQGDGHVLPPPDFEDPATLGCLVALVREAWNEPKVHAEPHRAGWWCYWADDSAPSVYFPTEAHALVAALEAAP